MANKRIKDLTEKSSFTTGDYFPIDNANGTKKVNASKIMTPLSNVQAEVTGGSDTYSSTKNYSVGMYATHTTGGVQKLYRCKTACTAASWTTNASCFEEANLADAVSALNNDLNIMPSTEWVKLNPSYGIYYKKQAGIVYVDFRGTAPPKDVSLGTFPVGFRPYHNINFTRANDSAAYITIYTSGAVSVSKEVTYQTQVSFCPSL